MAALASSAVTVSRAWTVVASPVRIKYKQLTIVLSSQGGSTNTVGATELGFTTLIGSSSAVLSDNTGIYPTTPSYDGSKLYFANLANATDATRINPADITGTVRLTVWGY